MNLEQLEAVSAVVEKGSFRAAAEFLHRSQPALSSTIKNLEEEFGLLLFDRNEYRPKLTEAGLAFLNVARATLDAANYTKRVAYELGKNKAETKLQVTVDPLVSIEVLEILAHECARPVLPVNLILDKSILQGSYQGLLEGKIDLAIAPCPPDAKRIEKIYLETAHLVGAVSRKLLAEKRKPNDAFLTANPQILVYDKRHDDQPDDLIPKPVQQGAGHKIYVPDHYTKLRLITGGIGWGRISRTEFAEAEDLVLIDSALCENESLELCLLRAKDRPLGPTAQTIWKAFKARSQNSVKKSRS